MNKLFLKIAAILNTLTVLIHLFLGQVDLINPLLDSTLVLQQKGELVGVWHMVTLLMGYTSVVLIKAGFVKSSELKLQRLNFIANLYILLSIPFIIVSLWYGILAPQWILLLPIGICIHWSLKGIK